MDFLRNVKQKEGESIRAFVSCCNMANSKDLQPRPLNRNVFFDEWTAKEWSQEITSEAYPRDFSYMLAQLEKYVQMKDAFMLEKTLATSSMGDAKLEPK